jgi:hypothetical protein
VNSSAPAGSRLLEAPARGVTGTEIVIVTEIVTGIGVAMTGIAMTGTEAVTAAGIVTVAVTTTATVIGTDVTGDATTTVESVARIETGVATIVAVTIPTAGGTVAGTALRATVMVPG